MSDLPAPIVVELREGAVIVRVNLKMFDDMHADVLTELIDQAAEKPGVSSVVLDMSRVQIIPSIGLGVLVQLSKKCKARQQKLKVAAVRPQIVKALNITALNKLFDLVDTVEEGITPPTPDDG